MNENHIKSVRIENFANHKDTYVTLEKGVNIITGTSDSGKTGFVRALMFVLDNMSSGSSFVNKLTKAKFAKVTVEFSDGRIISRSKGDSVNRVEYKYPEDDKFTVFSNFSTKYPEAVNKFLLNLPKDEENKALYYAKQSKKLFLIDHTPQSMPKALSQLLNIGDLEEVSKILNSEVNVIEKSLKLKTKEHDDLEKEIDEKYVDLENDIKLRDDLKLIVDECSDLENDLEEIYNYIDKFTKIKEKNRAITSKIEECTLIIDSMSETLDELETIENKFKDLSSYIKVVNNFSENKTVLENEIQKANKICDESFVSEISDIEELQTKAKNLLSYINYFDVTNESITNKRNEIKDCETTIDNAQKEYDKIKKILIDQKIVCSTCNKFGGELI